MDVEICATGLTRSVISSEEESIGNFAERRSRQGELNIYMIMLIVQKVVYLVNSTQGSRTGTFNLTRE